MTLWAQADVVLSPEELLWIEEHPVIRLAPDPSFAPMEFIEDGEYKGISSDFLKIIIERIGLEIEVLPVETWEETLNLLKAGNADINGATTPTAQRSRYLVFTDPVFDADILIFGTLENTSRIKIEDLKDKRVGITAGYAEDDYMALMHPEQRLLHFERMDEALRALSMGRLDYFIGDIAVVGFQKKTLGITNLVIAGELDYHHSLSIAVRADWPILRDILQKGLDTISETERNEIYEKWIGMKLENAYISKSVLPLIFTGAGIIFAVLILILLWNRTLARRIEEKTETINKELAAKSRQAEQLMISNQEKESLLHELQHRVNNNMQVIMSLLSFDSIENPEKRLSVRTQSRINVVAQAQERNHVDVRVNQIEIYSLAMDILYNLGRITNTNIFSRIRLKETNLFCDLNTAVALGLLFNEILLNLSEYEPFRKNGCEIDIFRQQDHSLCFSIQMTVKIPSPAVIEGAKNSQSGILIRSMIERLAGRTAISQFETIDGTGTLWNIIIPDPDIINF